MTINELIELSLEEDIKHGDVTTEYLAVNQEYIEAFLVSKDDGILSGLDIAFAVFSTVDPKIKFINYKKDGDLLHKGDHIAKITGSASSILKAERVALNFLQRLSGVSTLTNKFVSKIKPFQAKLLDTRKTTPMLRELEKYAVRVGGGYNHRFGLYDMIMLKENHIRAAGSITEAVKRVKKRNTAYKIEVEVTNLQELQEAIASKVDRVMLDNMSIVDMKKAVDENNGELELEASGNVSLDTISAIASTGVDYISTGAITHSYKSFDISLLFKE